MLTTPRSCWELVFYAAIQSGFMDAKILKPMYADDPTFKAAFPGVGDSGGALLETFKGRGLSPRLFVPKDPPKDLRAGDIIISNDGGNANHVFSIVGQEKPIENMRVRYILRVPCIRGHKGSVADVRDLDTGHPTLGKQWSGYHILYHTWGVFGTGGSCNDG